MNRLLKLPLGLTLPACLMLAIIGCDNSDPQSQGVANPPATSSVLSTNPVTAITSIGATTGGALDWSDTIHKAQTKGICWSSHPNPTLLDNKLGAWSIDHSFSVSISNLNSNTDYYVRAYITTSTDTIYGNELNFKTKIDSPSVCPCKIRKDTATFNYETHSFYSVSAEQDRVVDRQYIVEGHSSWSDLTITFPGIPTSGKYVTAYTFPVFPKRECIVSGVISNIYSTAKEGDTVYVTRTGINKYSVSYCGLSLSGTDGSNSFTFESSANLTAE